MDTTTTKTTNTMKATPAKPDPKKKASDKTPKEVKAKGNGKAVGGALVSYDPTHGQLQITSQAKQIIDALPQMTDENVMSLFGHLVTTDRAMFVVRGAAAYEIYRRATEAGREFSKTAGAGVDTLMQEVAKTVGVDYKTLYADFKVHEEFGGYLKEQLEKHPETIMPREYYVLAMKTSKLASELPMTILEYFEEQRQSVNYFVDHARRDIKLFNEGKSVDQVRKIDGKQRAEAVANKPAKKVKKDKFTQVSILETDENVGFIGQIIKKYGSFNEWFVRKCKQEFGEADEYKK